MPKKNSAKSRRLEVIRIMQQEVRFCEGYFPAIKANLRLMKNPEEHGYHGPLSAASIQVNEVKAKLAWVLDELKNNPCLTGE